jgi:hypothetical protein
LLAHRAHIRAALMADDVPGLVLRGSEKRGTRRRRAINPMKSRDVELPAFGVEHGTELSAKQRDKGTI